MESSTDKLFALLDFCGIRQREVVEHMGVSKATVSQWRVGGREMSPDDYTRVLMFAYNRYYPAFIAKMPFPCETPLEEIRAAHREFDQFVHHLEAAFLQRTPQRICEGLKRSLQTLEETLTLQSDPITWSAKTLKEMEILADHLVTSARLLRETIKGGRALPQLHADKDAHLDAHLDALARTQKEAS